jgi:hypothetical protein
MVISLERLELINESLCGDVLQSIFMKGTKTPCTARSPPLPHTWNPFACSFPLHSAQTTSPRLLYNPPPLCFPFPHMLSTSTSSLFSLLARSWPLSFFHFAHPSLSHSLPPPSSSSSSSSSLACFHPRVLFPSYTCSSRSTHHFTSLQGEHSTISIDPLPFFPQLFNAPFLQRKVLSC